MLSVFLRPKYIDLALFLGMKKKVIYEKKMFHSLSFFLFFVKTRPCVKSAQSENGRFAAAKNIY